MRAMGMRAPRALIAASESDELTANGFNIARRLEPPFTCLPGKQSLPAQRSLARSALAHSLVTLVRLASDNRPLRPAQALGQTQTRRTMIRSTATATLTLIASATCLTAESVCLLKISLRFEFDFKLIRTQPIDSN